MAYKKLNEAQMKELYVNLRGFFDNQGKNAPLIKLVNSYFVGAASVLVKVDSEYNDSTYDNKFTGVYVYDSKDVEIPLSRADREKFQSALNGISVNVPEETDEPLEDFVIYTAKDLPVVYIEVK